MSVAEGGPTQFAGPLAGVDPALGSLGVFEELNRTAIRFSSDKCLHELFEAQARRTPDCVAVVGSSGELTYGELDEQATLLAARLRGLGVGPDVLVAICLERSPAMVSAVLGVLKAGGAYVPIEPSLPRDRISFLLEDAGVKVVVTQQSLAGALPQTGISLVLIDGLSEEKVSEPGGGTSNPENLAYVRYTSGSTGKPKGVQIEHRSIVNFIESMRRVPGLTPEDVLLAVTTLSFDISELEIHLPLTTGARLVIVPQKLAGDGKSLLEAISRHGVTVMQATPATWRLLLDAGWEGTPGLKILCGGEPLPPDLASQLIPRCSELWNMYGPTETTVWSTCARIIAADCIHIGRPIANTEIFLLDERQQPVPLGTEGELLIGGVGLARGYLNRPELTAEKFIPHPFKPGERIYRTGDLARLRPDGGIDCLGRLDLQVKINGFRIEPEEIESVLASHPGIRQAVVVAQEESPEIKRLVAYFTSREGAEPSIGELRQLAERNLPSHMVPAVFVGMREIPLNSNGKVDRKALPKPSRNRPALARDYVAPRSAVESQLAALWSELLGLDRVGIDDTFFELGGTSLLAARMAAAWQARTGRELPLVKVFQYPTVGSLANWLENPSGDGDFIQAQERRAARHRQSGGGRQVPVAIIGMVGRFPGADDLVTLWRNLCEGVESISVFTREELGVGIDESLRHDPDYVPARGIIEGADRFDAAFFGIGALDASVMDPQQRVFLELAYAALENAGYDPDRFPGTVGVYAGAGDNRYYPINLLGHPKLLARAGRLAVEYGNEKDYIALRVAHTLNLTGPAVSSNTACSTTLLTIDQAVRGLGSFECDIALAGGVDIGIPQKSGFFHEEGGAFTRDGHCRPFDADASGTMFCDGAGVVVLRRLDDAIAAGDTIYAVITGTAKNNNGGRTASFLAPSVEGQAEVIAMAQANAAVPVETIGYIEAHGTGTPVGDPMEIEALDKVFRAKTSKRQFCYLGSIKGNIGHPTNAAGVAGLIKAALVLHHETIPGTLHFRKPNPRIDFENSCFKVADRLLPFPREAAGPRRAAVSSFGFGGTNVHAILEEAPEREPSGPSLPVQLLIVSARTPAAVDAYGKALATHFAGNEAALVLPDAASTLARGRKQWPHRRYVVAGDVLEAATLLREPHPLKSGAGECTRRDPQVVFLFGGQGTQYVNMGHNLYQADPLFRATVDECCDLLLPHLGRDLRELLFPAKGDEAAASESLRNTTYTQPALFTIEYATARWWQGLGLQPATMVGHSIGEFVAATLAGVFQLPDVLRVVAIRGRLMQSMPGGSMLSVRAPASQVESRLPPGLRLAAINSPSLCVVAGPDEHVAAAKAEFEALGWVCRELLTSHAFHSAMMDPILDPLRKELSSVVLKAPNRPLMSTVSGTPMTAQQACDPDYWASQARNPVRFSTAIQYLLGQGHDLFLECGPRNTLSTLTRQHAAAGSAVVAVPSLGDSSETNAELYALLSAVGTLWIQGVAIDWDAFYANENRKRIPLPTYPFERQRYWVEPAMASPAPTLTHASSDLVPAAGPGANQIPAPAAAAPKGRKERIIDWLKEIIAQISGVEVSLLKSSATFFELGLDSLALVQVTSAIRNELGQRIAFSQMTTEFPTLNLLAARLDEKLPEDVFREPEAQTPQAIAPRAEGSRDPAIDDLRRLIEEQGRMIARLTSLVEREFGQRPEQANPTEFPVTVPQRGIFLSSRLSEQLSASYNESVTIRIEGAVDAGGMVRALRRLSERHDALRSTFDEEGSILRFASTSENRVEIVDRKDRSVADRQWILDEVIRKECATPFSLPGGPLLRAVVVLLDSNHAAVVLTAHHVICDGWALDVLVHDFCAFYSQELGASSVRLDPVESYGGYLNLCADRARSEEFLAARRSCEERFAAGFPVLVLPSRGSRRTQRTFLALRKEIVVPGSTVKALRELGTRKECGLFALVLAAYSLLLARVSGQRHFVIALPIAEQPMIGQPQLAGHCVNMLPFEVDLRAGGTFEEFVDSVQRQLAHSYDHSVYTLTHILERLRPVTPQAGIRPVSVGLTHIKKWRPADLPQHGFAVDFDVNPREFESFEFYLIAIERAEDLVLRCTCDRDLFSESTIEGWMQDLDELLAGLPEHADTGLSELLPPVRESRDPQVIYSLLPEPGLSGPASGQATPVADKLESLSLDAMVERWQSLLGSREIGPDDNFFDAGGHSLVAAELFAALSKELRRPLPLSILLQASTPRALTRWIAQDGRPEHWKSLVPIQSSGSRPPLFLVHGAEGNILIYRALAGHLGSEQPVYGLQAAGVDGGPLGDTDFKSVASRYVAEIREVQPRGPYLLGGYCLGGSIALEIARQLLAAGEEVPVLAMFENYNVEALGWPLPAWVRILNHFFNLWHHFLNVVEAPRGSRWAFIQEKARVEYSRAQSNVRFWHARVRRFWKGSSEVVAHVKVGDAYDAALCRYHVEPYAGPIQLFLPKRRLMGLEEEQGGWGSVAPGKVELFTLRTNPRGSMVEPHVRETADLLRNILTSVSEREAAITAEPKRPAREQEDSYPSSCAA